jgi:hypothetical protein
MGLQVCKTASVSPINLAVPLAAIVECLSLSVALLPKGFVEEVFHRVSVLFRSSGFSSLWRIGFGLLRKVGLFGMAIFISTGSGCTFVLGILCVIWLMEKIQTSEKNSMIFH